MKKLGFGQAISILANVGVIAGIVFLGYEMRQNTDAIQASTLQGMVDVSSSYLIETSLNEGFIRVLSEAQENPDQLSDIEALQVQRLIRSQWLRYAGAYRNWRRGALGEEEWEQYRRLICGNVENVGQGSYEAVQAKFWRFERSKLAEDFVAVVESCRPNLAAATN